jgi:hypothetical protein
MTGLLYSLENKHTMHVIGHNPIKPSMDIAFNTIIIISPRENVTLETEVFEITER